MYTNRLHGVPWSQPRGICQHNARQRLALCRLAAAAPAAPRVQLKRAKLGTSDLEVSEVCFGTMTFGEQNLEQEAHQLLSYALEAGVTFFDTAELYPVSPRRETGGRTSTILGTWLRHQARNRLVIASKVAGRSAGLQWLPANRTVPRGEERCPVVDGAAIIAAAEGELRRLQTDYIDVFQLHWPDRYVPAFGRAQYHPENEWAATPFEEQVVAIGQLIQQGKVRHWGLSNETPLGVITHCLTADKLGVPRPVTIQNSYSLVHRSFEEGGLAEACAPSNFNLGLLPWSALAGGALSGKYTDGTALPNSRMSLWPDRYARFIAPRTLRAVDKYAAIAAEAGLTPAQLGYAFVRSRWFVPSVIVGATSMQQLTENLGAFGAPLSPEVLAAIDEVHLEHRNPALMD